MRQARQGCVPGRRLVEPCRAGHTPRSPATTTHRSARIPQAGRMRKSSRSTTLCPPDGARHPHLRPPLPGLVPRPVAARTAPERVEAADPPVTDDDGDLPPPAPPEAKLPDHPAYQQIMAVLAAADAPVRARAACSPTGICGDAVRWRACARSPPRIPTRLSFGHWSRSSAASARSSARWGTATRYGCGAANPSTSGARGRRPDAGHRGRAIRRRRSADDGLSG